MSRTKKKPYLYGSGRYDKTCRPHGGQAGGGRQCPYCLNNRMHTKKKRELKADQSFDEAVDQILEQIDPEGDTIDDYSKCAAAAEYFLKQFGEAESIPSSIVRDFVAETFPEASSAEKVDLQSWVFELAYDLEGENEL